MLEVESHKIMDMDEEKRNRVINAAMKEFSKGFKHASTDEIVKEAGISKGLLFHYFGSKEKLYEFILLDTIDIMKNNYFDLINFELTDILDRIWQMSLLKMDLSQKYPLLFDFAAAAYMNEQENPGGKFNEMYKEIQASVAMNAFKNIDTSIFKDDIEPQKIINIIWWTLMGYANAQVDRTKSISSYKSEYERYLSEMEEYFNIFRKIFYKEEYIK
ncbi:MAG: TetR/AcrR family transcriptional regulator [Oscillospiraceae bacterium]|nr:TetR/AcrR family transcriptional regulator [Oscillospiraceae bacterium]